MMRPVNSVKFMLEMNLLVIFPVIMPSGDMQGPQLFFQNFRKAKMHIRSIVLTLIQNYVSA